MKAKMVTSILSGLLIPWLYFLFVTVSPMTVYEEGEPVGPSRGASGITLFLEHNGIIESLVIYGQSAASITLAVFAICTFNNWLANKL